MVKILHFLIAFLVSTTVFANSPFIFSGSGPKSLQSLTNGVLKSSSNVLSGGATTSDLTEGSNLYYTDARVQTAAKNGTSNLIFKVSKDAGNDANDCSILKPCKTIGAGITAANAVAAYYKQAMVLVDPSNGTTSYNENITLSQQGVVLQCANPVQNSRACVINGTVTVNLTGTSGGANYNAASNEVYMNGFVVTAGSGVAITFSGSTYQKATLTNCYMQAGSGQSAVVTNTGVSGSTPSELRSYDTTFENNSASNPTVTLTAGRFWLYGTTPTVQNTNAAGPSFTQNGASSMIANVTQFTGQYNLTDNTATATFNLSTIASGTNPCIVTPSSPNTGYALLAYFGCNSSNTNSITGSGVVVNAPGNVRFGSSGDIISTVTQAAVGPGLPQGELMLGAGAVTGTNVLLSLKNGHIRISQTTAPTATVNANAGTGATCTLSSGSTDLVGKINLTTTATAPAAGTQCTVTLNKTFGVTPTCFGGAQDANSILFSVTNGSRIVGASATTLIVTYANADTLGHANVFWYNCYDLQ